MSDSDFEDLTVSTHHNMLVKEIQEKTNEIAQLKKQLNQLNIVTEQHKKTQQFYQQQAIRKDQLVNEMTSSTFRLSCKIVEQQSMISELKEQLLQTEKHYQSILQNQLQQKQQQHAINEQLHSQLQTTQQATKIYEEKLKQQQGKICQLSVELSKNDAKLKNTLSQLLKLQGQSKYVYQHVVENLKRQLKEINENVNHLKYQNKLITQEKTKLINQDNQKSTQILCLDKQISQLKQSSNCLISQMQQCRHQIAYLQTRIRNYTDQSRKQLQLNKQNEQKLQQKQATNKRLNNLIAQLDLGIYQINKQNMQLNTQLKEKESQLLALHMNIQQLNEHIAQLELSKQSNKKQAIVDKVNSQQLQAIKGQLKQQYSSNKSLEQQLTQSTKKYQKLQLQFKQFEQILTSLSHDSENYRLQTIELTKQLQTIKIAQKHSQQLEQSTKQLEQPKPSQQIRQSKQLQLRLTALEQQNSMLNEIIQTLENKLIQKDNKLNQKEHQLQSLLNQLEHNKPCQIQALLNMVKQLSRQIEEKVSIAISSQSPQEKLQIERKQKQSLLDQVTQILFKNYPLNEDKQIQMKKVEQKVDPYENKRSFFPKSSNQNSNQSTTKKHIMRNMNNIRQNFRQF